LGYTAVSETRISKYIEISFESDDRATVMQQTEEICKNLLANPNTETYHFELEQQN
jgi:phosphoribosylformylglycinamidine synthase